jgi:hypothetical protein
MLALIHVFLDNARYHQAKLVQELPIKLHFISPRISIRSSRCGVLCTETLRTTSALQLARNSPMRR